MWAVLRPLCLVLALLALLAGVLGMAASFLVMGSALANEVRAGASGFVAGSVLIGSALVSLTLLARRERRVKQEGSTATTEATPGPSSFQQRR
jgi:hypothetical protein